jgi:hypothetical protein
MSVHQENWQLSNQEISAANFRGIVRNFCAEREDARVANAADGAMDIQPRASDALAAGSFRSGGVVHGL